MSLHIIIRGKKGAPPQAPLTQKFMKSVRNFFLPLLLEVIHLKIALSAL
jgi:hypothetical protein